MLRRFKIRVQGKRGDYWRYTVSSWLKEIKDILEQEYHILLEVIEEDADLELPRIFVENELVLEGVPGEEGYLLEALKRVFDKLIGSPM